MTRHMVVTQSRLDFIIVKNDLELSLPLRSFFFFFLILVKSFPDGTQQPNYVVSSPIFLPH